MRHTGPKKKVQRFIEQIETDTSDLQAVCKGSASMQIAPWFEGLAEPLRRAYFRSLKTVS